MGLTRLLCSKGAATGCYVFVTAYPIISAYYLIS